MAHDERRRPTRISTSPGAGCSGGTSRSSIWSKAGYRPDVVVGFDEEHYHLLRGLGRRIPEEIAYINLARPLRNFN